MEDGGLTDDCGHIMAARHYSIDDYPRLRMSGGHDASQ
jgi:hypothetical protein